MRRLSDERGLGVVEWILIIVLVIMVIVTVYFLFKPALVLLWQQTLQSIQG